VEHDAAQLRPGVASRAATPIDKYVMRPSPRLLRSAHEAELAAAEWLQWLGFGDARCTGRGPDQGIDVIAQGLVAQVKAEMRKSTRPQLQHLCGAASRYGGFKTAFFSLAGYTDEAMEWAEQLQIYLFRFDLQGEPQPCNNLARHLFDEAASIEAQPATAIASGSPAETSNYYGDNHPPPDHADEALPFGAYKRLLDLPRYYAAEPKRKIDTSWINWRPLDWPLEDQGEPAAWSTMVGSSKLDPSQWTWLDPLNDEAILVALNFRKRLYPRPALQFGVGRTGQGWACAVFEAPAPSPMELYAVEVAKLPTGGAHFNLDEYGMTPPVAVYCTSLEAAIEYTRPWRERAASEQDMVLVVNACESAATNFELAHDTRPRLPLSEADLAGENWAMLDARAQTKLSLGHGWTSFSTAPGRLVAEGLLRTLGQRMLPHRDQEEPGALVSPSATVAKRIWTGRLDERSLFSPPELSVVAGKVLVAHRSFFSKPQFWLIDLASKTELVHGDMGNEGIVLLADGLVFLCEPSPIEAIHGEKPSVSSLSWDGVTVPRRSPVPAGGYSLEEGRPTALSPRSVLIERSEGTCLWVRLDADPRVLKCDLGSPQWGSEPLLGVIRQGCHVAMIRTDGSVAWRYSLEDEESVNLFDSVQRDLVIVAGSTNWYEISEIEAGQRLDPEDSRYDQDRPEEYRKDLEAEISGEAARLRSSYGGAKNEVVLEALDRSTGASVWRQCFNRSKGFGAHSTDVVGNVVVVSSEGLKGLDLATGRLKWHHPELAGCPSAGTPLLCSRPAEESGGLEQVLLWPESGIITQPPIQLVEANSCNRRMSGGCLLLQDDEGNLELYELHNVPAAIPTQQDPHRLNHLEVVNDYLGGAS